MSHLCSGVPQNGVLGAQRQRRRPDPHELSVDMQGRRRRSCGGCVLRTDARRHHAPSISAPDGRTNALSRRRRHRPEASTGGAACWPRVQPSGTTCADRQPTPLDPHDASASKVRAGRCFRRFGAPARPCRGVPQGGSEVTAPGRGPGSWAGGGPVGDARVLWYDRDSPERE